MYNILMIDRKINHDDEEKKILILMKKGQKAKSKKVQKRFGKV